MRKSKLLLVKDELINLYHEGIGTRKLGRKYNVSPQTILNFLKRNHVNIKPCQKIPEAKHNEIIKLYQDGVSCPKIAKIYKVHFSTIWYILTKYIKCRKCEDTHRKYTLDEKAFDNIDSDAKAYWLGFLLADGTNTNGHRICVTLSVVDEKHVIKFKNFLKSNRPLYKIKPQGFPGAKGQVGIAVNSKYMASTLKGKGMVQNKTYILTFPNIRQVEEKYWPGLIRGIFDGDGHVSFYKRGDGWKGMRSCWGISGTIELCQEIQKIIKEKFKINVGISIKKTSRNLAQIYATINQNFMPFYNWLYKDSLENTRLNRKYEKFEEIFKYLNLQSLKEQAH